jgi:hypothetical protein
MRCKDFKQVLNNHYFKSHNNFWSILYKPCVSLSLPKVKQLKGRRPHPTPQQLPFANYIHDMLDEADITTS